MRLPFFRRSFGLPARGLLLRCTVHMPDHTATMRETFYQKGDAFPIRVLEYAELSAFLPRFEALYDSGRYRGCTQVAPGELHVRFKPHLLYTWMHALVHHPRVLDQVESILGPDILVWASAIFIKNGNDPAYAAGHQDINSNTLEGREQVSTWIALTPSTKENGCMRVIPRSHLNGRMRHEETDDNENYLARRERLVMPVDESAAVDVVLAPGEMSLHHLATVHASWPNTSSQRRIGYAVRYIAPQVEPVGQRETAMLARGKDRYGYFEPESRPAADLDTNAIEAFRRAAGVRIKNFYG